MNSFPENVRFRFSWRPYQERVLQEFERQTSDGHVHIVAAPGSGKTVLGLELARRLNQPVLILAPTTAIRDQWVRRLVDSFLVEPAVPDWVSTDLTAPRFLTVATYQALHAAQRKLSFADLLSRLKCCCVRTLVLDEAHHLRAQWWKCLTDLKAQLESATVVSLTGTAPYDVSQVEWNRYIQLCGPVDAEVHVPELVLAGNLCPHQDYIYFSVPTASELAELERFDHYVRKLVNDLALNRPLVDLIAEHPVVAAPDDHLDEILERSDYYLSIAVFLGETASETVVALRRTMGLENVALPAFHAGWAEVLLNGMLFERDLLLTDTAGLLAGLTRDLRHHGAVDHRQVYLFAPPRLRRLLESSLNKCQSIASIIEMEARSNSLRLRAVVLCDHIREADFPGPADDARPFTRLGVVPVFEYIRKLNLADVHLGVMTGSVVILPLEALARFAEIASEAGVAYAEIATEPLWHAPQFHRVTGIGKGSVSLLELMTRLFTEGEITVLIGTASLLGEGWDAPAINTLVLASSVGTAITSNQMRGRAIRVQAGNEFKTANIWHLACLTNAGGTAGREVGFTGGADMEMLTRRFRSFAGLAIDAPLIENGIHRLRINPLTVKTHDAVSLNAKMCGLAQDRETLRQRWKQALENKAQTPKRMVLESLVAEERIPRGRIFEHFLRRDRSGLLRWWRTRVLLRRTRNIASAVLDTLCQTGRIKTAYESLRLDVRSGAQTMNCRLYGGTTHEESLFSETFREVFDLLQTPRYLLRYKRSFYAVPKCLGENKKIATLFNLTWRKHVGSAELLYSKTPEGKKALLQGREGWLAFRHRDAETKLHWD